MARPGNYEEIIGTGPSLTLFLESVAKFDRAFCDHMAEGDDFTLKLEVRGDAGKIVHVRTSSDGFKRPDVLEEKSSGIPRNRVLRSGVRTL